MCCIFKAHAKVKCMTIIAQKDKEGLVVDFCEILTLHIKFFSIFLLSSSFSHSVMSDSLQPRGLQKARLPCPSPSSQCLLKLMSNFGMSSTQLHPLASASPPVFNLSKHQGPFQSVCSSHQVAISTGASASASILRVNIQD